MGDPGCAVSGDATSVARPSSSLQRKLRGFLSFVVRHASAVALVMYLSGSLGGLLALTSAGRPGGVDEKAFQLGVATPQLGATKTADVMRLFHVQKDMSAESMLEDVRAVWEHCETHWYHAPGRRHRLRWYGGQHVVYDVVEATRADGTESVLLVIPYTKMGVAMGHGLGWYLQEQEWLAKNVAILYVNTTAASVESSVSRWLQTSVDPRIGQIQQAVVLDVDDKDHAGNGASIRVHGWNGRLPNLDLFMVARKSAEMHFTSNSKIKVHDASTQSDPALNKVAALARFVARHGLGLADGGHSALLDQGIDALTVQLLFQKSNSSLKGALQMIEGIVRALNNLHERLHHATGLYALAGAYVVIDIGMYTVCPALLLLAGVLKAYQLTLFGLSPSSKDPRITWNEAVRWTVGCASAAAALYVNAHTLARHRAEEGHASLEMVGSSVLGVSRIALGAFILSKFLADPEHDHGKDGPPGWVRRDAALAWALCVVSAVLILYRWSLAWMLLSLVLPFFLTKFE
jgi:hypothetical protein